MTYRRDIDGLRAVAVMLVVLGHSSLGFPGGFIGVDVFFVISGFLITGILNQEIAEGHFSVAKFYERRARRIFPALFVTLFGCFIAAAWLFMPPELELFAWSAAAATFFGSNFLFMAEDGYFDVISEVKPLLHTWSLAVEEQFYVVFPLLLALLIRRYPTHVNRVFIALAVVSFVLGSYYVATAPEVAFFSSFGRAWELLAGAALALRPFRFPPSRALTNAAAAIGLSLIIVPALLYSADTPFPGPAAVPPVLGAILLIAAGENRNIVSNLLLASKPFVGIGLISYSLYLVHWPIVVFTRYRLGISLDALTGLAVVAVSLALAALMWRFVETPFRGRRSRVSGSAVFGLSAASMAAASLCAGILILGKGWPQRLPAAVLAVYSAGTEKSKFMSSECFVFDGDGPSAEDIREGRLCTLGKRTYSPAAFILWGDSHAGALAPAVDKAAAALGIWGYLVGQATCPPLLNYQQSSRARHAMCKVTNDAVIELLKRQHIGTAILHARWARYVNGGPFGNEGPFFDPRLPVARDDKSPLIAARLDQTLLALSALGVRTAIIEDAPEIGYDLPVVLARAMLYGRKPDLAPAWPVVKQRQDPAKDIFAAAREKFVFDRLDPKDLLCDAQRCKVIQDGTLLYSDEDHLSPEGSLLLVPSLIDLLKAR